MAEIVILESAEAASSLAARHIAARVTHTPQLVLGVATGSTPGRLYTALAEIRRSERLDTSKVSAFALDEYLGLPPGHPESYAEVVRREVVEPLGLDPALVHVPGAGSGKLDPFSAAEAYDVAIRAAGGVDVQILGIGENGHIGFNEPGSSLASRTRVKTLSRSTRAANARFFDGPDDVPAHCITQGIGTILEARHLMLLAFGAHKAAAVAAAVEGPISASVPGSAVQLHAHVTVLLDREAARELRFRDEYEHAWKLKPGAQSL